MATGRLLVEEIYEEGLCRFVVRTTKRRGEEKEKKKEGCDVDNNNGGCGLVMAAGRRRLSNLSRSFCRYVVGRQKRG